MRESVLAVLATNSKKTKKLLVFLPIAGLLLVLLAGMITPKVYAAGETISGGSDRSGYIDEYIDIDGLAVDGNSEDEVSLSISADSNTALLKLTVTTGLTITSNNPSNTLKFSGAVGAVNDALNALKYRNSAAGAINITASIIQDGEVFYPGNGHLYEVVNVPSGISADDALTAAAARTKYGSQGYLATVTSAAEDNYISGRLGNDGWMGASDATTEGDWKWITGPEAGTSFWSGLSDGSAVAGRYSSWASGEPNDSYDENGEDCAQFLSGGGWNDLSCYGWDLPYYVVEYGAPGDLPTIESDSFTVTTTIPEANDVPIGNCLDLIGIEEVGLYNRFDNLYLTDDIDCTGESLTPMFNDIDDEGNLLGFRGTFDGNGHTISGVDIVSDQYGTGLVSVSKGATFTDIVLSGSINGGEDNDCTGGLVGAATDTTFDNVSIGATVQGDYDVGGIVGCAYFDSGSSQVVNNSITGTIAASSQMGGIAGYMSADSSDASVEIADNNIDGDIFDETYHPDGYNWAVGGISGELFGDNYASIDVHDNTVQGIDNQYAESVGGLFGYMGNDDYAEIAITSNHITGAVSANYTVGGLIGYGYTYDQSKITISDTELDQNVTSISGAAGGVAAELYAEGDEGTEINITEISGSGDVSGVYSTGGIVGEMYRDNDEENIYLAEIAISGTITSTDDYAGGLVADAGGLTIEKSHATGDVYAYESAGGLVGYMYDSELTDSYATGNVTAEYYSAGGLVGRNSSDSYIAESYATGDVAGESRVGGIAGAVGDDAEVINSYSRGNVTAGDNVGGLVGRCGGAISNSYATGEISTEDEETGPQGLLGSDQGCDVENSFWDTQTSGASDSFAGTAKTTAQMKTKTTFTDADWDFSSIWNIFSGINDGYPCLTWQQSCDATDDDQDGIPTSIENAGPNSGDANGDGIQDSEQSSVASFVDSLTGKYAALEVNEDCTIESVTLISEAEVSDIQDSGYDYPAGLMDFRIDCGTPGFTATVKQYYYGVTGSFTVRKYTPASSAYTAIPGATVSDLTIGGQHVKMGAYQLSDGSDFDLDGETNGSIEDPAGLAESTVGSPNTGLKLNN